VFIFYAGKINELELPTPSAEIKKTATAAHSDGEKSRLIKAVNRIENLTLCFLFFFPQYPFRYGRRRF
jgi:hypothetical protein